MKLLSFLIILVLVQAPVETRVDTGILRNCGTEERPSWNIQLKDGRKLGLCFIRPKKEGSNEISKEEGPDEKKARLFIGKKVEITSRKNTFVIDRTVFIFVISFKEISND